MSVTISGSMNTEDDVTLSLGHSFKGVHEDLTKYLVYDLYKEEEGRNQWKIDMTLPHPYSQASGDLTLSVGDSHSGDVTTTRLTIIQEGKEAAPFFDPVPKSAQASLGEDVLINTRAKGSVPINVSYINI